MSKLSKALSAFILMTLGLQKLSGKIEKKDAPYLIPEEELHQYQKERAKIPMPSDWVYKPMSLDQMKAEAKAYGYDVMYFVNGQLVRIFPDGTVIPI